MKRLFVLFSFHLDDYFVPFNGISDLSVDIQNSFIFPLHPIALKLDINSSEKVSNDTRFDANNKVTTEI